MCFTNTLIAISQATLFISFVQVYHSGRALKALMISISNKFCSSDYFYIPRLWLKDMTAVHLAFIKQIQCRFLNIAVYTFQRNVRIKIAVPMHKLRFQMVGYFVSLLVKPSGT